jgi:hypothetical protein
VIDASVVGAAASALGSLVAVGGSVFTVRQAKSAKKSQQATKVAQDEVEQRRLDQLAFKAFTERYDQERKTLEDHIERQRKEVLRQRDLLRHCFDYIIMLKVTMRDNGVEVPNTPVELTRGMIWGDFNLDPD